ncbi:CTR1 suppressor protein [Boeremia exigua]|uniref:CTR1 suppressor protein n=1 Tax=Boeremia exigua TaxID=749465 RepID=UPI001E8CA315|nr:CTR1 suppressor protein [Boeremia exigua]KAH6633333.1 CTR1 suppressor protein [Boeremia exigua]
MAKQVKGKTPIAVMNKYVYDAFLWTFSILVELFFREVHPRSSWKVPKEGPVIFVCAPHANQFVDPLMLMRVVKKESDRRIQFLIADKSMKRRFIGAMAGLTGVVPVGRAMDATKPATGMVYLPDPINDPCLLRGVGTNFEDSMFMVGGSIVLPKVDNKAATAEILEVRGPEEIRLKRGFKGGVAMQQLTGRNDMTKDGVFIDGASARRGVADGFEGINFLVAPKLDQTEVYDAVHAVLHHGGSIGIFPEGGSHDRTDLLPLKAGVAIMALGTVASKPDCNLKIIPVGMNYFHAHKFRSRAVIEFGTPINIPPELAQKFEGPGRREAIGDMLESVRQGLISVTVTTPDYETLQVIQAVRRLYNSKGTKLPLPRIVELNRRLVKGYERFKDDPRIVKLRTEVISYNAKLRAVGFRDHQVQYATMHPLKAFILFWYRLSKLLILTAFVLPGTMLFGLVFVATKMISIKKAKEALAASNVKVQARDVMATWKLLVAMAVAPACYLWYISLGLLWYRYNNCNGYVPAGIQKRYLIVIQAIIYPTVTYAALRFGEVAMDILKSLVPLWKMMNPFSSEELVKIKQRRENLAERVNELINELGPEMFDDFYSKRILHDPFIEQGEPGTPPQKSRAEAEEEGPASIETYDYPISPTSPGTENELPRNESFHDLANQDIFSTRPPTPKRGRSRNSSSSNLGFQLKPFSTIDGNLDIVKQRLKDGVRERRHKRRSSGASGLQDGFESDRSSEAGELEGLTMTKRKSK